MMDKALLRWAVLLVAILLIIIACVLVTESDRLMATVFLGAGVLLIWMVLLSL